MNDRFSAHFLCYQINLQNQEYNRNHFCLQYLATEPTFWWCKSRWGNCLSLLGLHLYSITIVLRVEGVSAGQLVLSSAQNSQPQQVAQGHVQSGFEYLHNLSGQRGQCLTTLAIKKVFHMFKWNFLFDFVPTASCPATGYYWAIFSSASHQIFVHINKVPKEGFPGWRIPALSLSSYVRCSRPFAGFAPVCPCLCCIGEPRNL